MHINHFWLTHPILHWLKNPFNITFRNGHTPLCSHRHHPVMSHIHNLCFTNNLSVKVCVKMFGQDQRMAFCCPSPAELWSIWVSCSKRQHWRIMVATKISIYLFRISILLNPDCCCPFLWTDSASSGSSIRRRCWRGLDDWISPPCQSNRRRTSQTLP